MWKFPNQQEQYVANVYPDANFVGCKRSRKSTSGGLIVLGQHCIKAWSKTQSLVAISSAESEFYSVVKASCERRGFCTLFKDLGMELKIRVHMDASAAKGIIEKKGVSRVRHLDTSVLWLQEQLIREMLP